MTTPRRYVVTDTATGRTGCLRQVGGYAMGKNYLDMSWVVLWDQTEEEMEGLVGCRDLPDDAEGT